MISKVQCIKQQARGLHEEIDGMRARNVKIMENHGKIKREIDLVSKSCMIRFSFLIHLQRQVFFPFLAEFSSINKFKT
jgi:hypothetical protein